MKRTILITIISAALCAVIQAQPREAAPADVASADAIVKAVYDVISGDAGKARDWDRFRSLFYEGARLIPVGTDPATKKSRAVMLSPEDFIKRFIPNSEKNGFHEREKARRTEVYGHIAHVFSTYESFHSAADKEPFMRGINSFQLFNDGSRWWIITIYWQPETKELPIPKDFLKSRN